MYTPCINCKNIIILKGSRNLSDEKLWNKFLVAISLVTQTHSSHALERVWWTPASSLVQPNPRVWRALNSTDWWWITTQGVMIAAIRHKAITNRVISNVMHQNLFYLSFFSAVSSLHWILIEGISKELKLLFKRWGWWLRYYHHPLCSYSPPISGHLMLPRFWG